MNTWLGRSTSGIVVVAAWLYVLRRVALGAVLLTIVGLAGFMVFMALIRSRALKP